MNHIRVTQIIVGIIFVSAVILGLLQRDQELFGFNTSSVNFGGTSDGSLEDYYNKSQQLTGKSEQKITTTFLAVGDIMLSRNVAQKSFEAVDPALPFRKLTDLLASTDFNFGNLESPVYNSGNPCLTPTGEITTKGIVGGHSLIFGAPCSMVHSLKDFNFKILNLANNHALDQTFDGLLGTMGALGDLDIQFVGTGENIEQAWQPSIIEENGIKICFIGASYASINDNGKTVNNYVARIEDVENLKVSIETCKQQSDFIVATMHAGTEYMRKPNQAQLDFAHTAIDAGADIVIGAHPHWIQTLEKYKDKYIFYSLGNFIFDQEWSQDTKEGLTIKITLSKSGCHQDFTSKKIICSDGLQGQKIPAQLDQIELIPVIIENYSTPRLANEEETKKILKKIDQTENILK